MPGSMMISARKSVQDIKKHQRRIFLMGIAAAAVPIGCQVLVLGVIYAYPGDFPKADKILLHFKFWPIQIVLLCVAISGTAIVDFGKLIIDYPARTANVVLQFIILLLFFLAVSVMFCVTLLDAELGWTFLIAMIIFATFNLGLAYRVEMDIAFIEANLLIQPIS